MSDTLKKIHRTSMRILEEVGIRLHHPAICGMLKENSVRVEADTAFFTEEQLFHWVNQAPGRFCLSARNGRHDMLIGGANTEYAAGYGCASIVDREGQRREATLSDFLCFTKLVQQCEPMHINGGILVQPCEIIDHSRALMLYATLTHSDKCAMGIPGSAEQVEQLMQLVAITVGGTDRLRERPRLITMISTLSPLQIDRLALETMSVCARYRQPMIISPAPAAGTTGPIHLGGNIALANAEALAAIAIAEMLCPGIPVVYGLQAYAADMQSGHISIGSPGYSVQAQYCARLARMYGLPSRTGGANTDAKSVSVQSGYEAMMSMLVARQSQVNLIIHAAGILDSYGAMSYEKFMVDLEIIRMVESFMADIRTDPEDFALEEIKGVGIGGQFLTSEQTCLHWRTESFLPAIGLRGSPLHGVRPDDQIQKNIEQQKQRLLSEYRRPELPGRMLAALDDYMIGAIGVEQEILDRIRSKGGSAC